MKMSHFSYPVVRKSYDHEVTWLITFPFLCPLDDILIQVWQYLMKLNLENSFLNVYAIWLIFFSFFLLIETKGIRRKLMKSSLLIFIMITANIPMKQNIHTYKYRYTSYNYTLNENRQTEGKIGFWWTR